MPPHPPAARAAALVARLCRLIDAAESPPSLAALAAHAGMSRFHLHRLFVAQTGLTPHAWARARRAEKLRSALAAGASVTDAMHDAGYGSSSRLYEGNDLGMTPSRYRAGGEGSDVRFAIAGTSLGALLVAAGERGICAIALGDDPDALASALQQRFARARLIAGDSGFDHLVARVIALVEAPGMGHDLPLDLRGTAFQRRVWIALQAIPPGCTLSYRELAERIGAPRAVRAVAAACAANELAVAVPCHRVVRSDGGLAGYRWGVARKQALIEREAPAGDAGTGQD